jgi:hypothetical protein
MEEQVKILNKYIRELAKENEMLQDKNNDMRTTLTQNKQLLGEHPLPVSYRNIDDYINNIGESDQVVIKLKVEVDALRRESKQKDDQIR